MSPYDGAQDWHTLCELASKEQDSERLIELVQRLNDVLDANAAGRAEANLYLG